MGNALTEMFELLSPATVEREINGKQVTFYQCSLGTCAKLQGFLSKMAGHLSTLLGSTARDQGTVQEDYTSEEGEFITKTVTQPINPDLAVLRATQRQSSLEGAVAELMSDKCRAVVGQLLMNSLKDNFSRKEKPPAEECLAFVDMMDLSTFIQFMRGLAEANAKIFGDLGKGLGLAVQARAEEVLGQVSGKKPEVPPTDG